MKIIHFELFVFISLLFPSPLHAQGIVKGRVVFEGTPPAAEKVEVQSDTATCGTEKEIRRMILGEGQGVAGAVVKILGAAGSSAPREGTLDQVSCEFVPHLQALPLNSTLKITSSDPVLHNSHGFFEDGSTAFNIAVPIAGMELTTKLDKPGIIKLRCDAGHTWMSAYVVVPDEAHFAVTGENGNFSLEGVPPGSYEIEVWQEWLGKTKQPVEVKEGETEVTIILKNP